jgi:hypothetical protein
MRPTSPARVMARHDVHPRLRALLDDAAFERVTPGRRADVVLCATLISATALGSVALCR